MVAIIIMIMMLTKMMTSMMTIVVTVPTMITVIIIFFIINCYFYEEHIAKHDWHYKGKTTKQMRKQYTKQTTKALYKLDIFYMLCRSTHFFIKKTLAENK